MTRLRCLLALGWFLVLAVPAHAGARVGRSAPDFTLPDWAGRQVTLAELRGHPVLVDFWASWCDACKRALPGLDAIARRHADRGLRTLAINVDQHRGKADEFLAAHLPATAMTMLHDPRGAVLARFGAAGMPALYLIDRDGVVRLIEAGYAPERLDATEDVIRRLLE